MICPRCLKKNASVHISRNINGNKEEFNVCEDCAKEMGFFGGGDLLFNISDFMSGFLGKGISPSLSEEKICPSCGMSINEFAKTSKLGCSKCYDFFDSFLEPLMKRIHGNTRHVGKLPVNVDESLKKERTLSSLKEELKAAVAREDYEKAASLRDKIRQMEGDNNVV
ncbi:MAG: UvrB/UvrC motif-containing protein [Monoglobales bacterium]